MPDRLLAVIRRLARGRQLSATTLAGWIVDGLAAPDRMAIPGRMALSDHRIFSDVETVLRHRMPALQSLANA